VFAGEALGRRGVASLRGRQALPGLVPAVVAELELVGPPAQREAEDLVPETDAEDRDLPEERRHPLRRALDGVRIAGPVRQEDAVGPHGEYVPRRRVRRHDADAAPGADDVPQDVVLDAEVGRDDVEDATAALGSRLRGG